MLQEHQSRPLWARELKPYGANPSDIAYCRAPCGRVN